MLLAPKMVIVGIFAEICLCTCFAFFLKGCSFLCDSVGCLNVEDFFGKYFRGEGGKGGDAAFEVVTTKKEKRLLKSIRDPPYNRDTQEKPGGSHSVM